MNSSYELLSSQSQVLNALDVPSREFAVQQTPMHNFTVPAALKAWIDHIVRVRRTFAVSKDGKLGRLRDRLVFVAVSSGGVYSADHARQPDFLTLHLKTIFATIGLLDVTFFSVEGTVLGSDALVKARARADQALKAHFGKPTEHSPTKTAAISNS